MNPFNTITEFHHGSRNSTKSYVKCMKLRKLVIFYKIRYAVRNIQVFSCGWFKLLSLRAAGCVRLGWEVYGLTQLERLPRCIVFYDPSFSLYYSIPLWTSEIKRGWNTWNYKIQLLTVYIDFTVLRYASILIPSCFIFMPLYSGFRGRSRNFW